MSSISSRIAVSKILAPLAECAAKERRLIECGESFYRKYEKEIERDRNKLRRSGIVAADWTPNETDADHGYWNAWSKRIRQAAGKLKKLGEPVLASELLLFCEDIADRDEVTCNSDFRFEELAEWLASVMAGNKKEVNLDVGPVVAESTERPAKARDHLFLEWYETAGEPTHHSHAAIKNKWNSLSSDERKRISPRASNKVESRDVIVKAVKRATKEKKSERS